MATNTYAVPPTFPAGVIPGQLSEYMTPIWPADVFPIETLARTKPDSNGVITTGTLDIETQRVLTPTEESDALAAFLIFVPTILVGGGRLIAQLEDGGPTSGVQVYVSDESRQGAGTGVLCYWAVSDRTWRRVRDDVTVAVIP